MFAEKYLELLQNLKERLSPDLLEKIHYRSVTNFLIHFEKLSNKDIVRILIIRYFEEIRDHDYIIDRDLSRDLFHKYLAQIGKYYNFQLGFKSFMPFKYSIGVAIIIDGVVLFLGILKKIYYIPITTILGTLGHEYLYFFYGKKNRLFGLYY
jgi:hypothetical protein